jgi:hypothetical protein
VPPGHRCRALPRNPQAALPRQSRQGDGRAGQSVGVDVSNAAARSRRRGLCVSMDSQHAAMSTRWYSCGCLRFTFQKRAGTVSAHRLPSRSGRRRQSLSKRPLLKLHRFSNRRCFPRPRLPSRPLLRTACTARSHRGTPHRPRHWQFRLYVQASLRPANPWETPRWWPMRLRPAGFDTAGMKDLDHSRMVKALQAFCTKADGCAMMSATTSSRRPASATSRL